MTLNLTPAWLYNHSITVKHQTTDALGRLATPVPAEETVTGRFQLATRNVRTASGEEVASIAVAFLPASVSVGPSDLISYGGTDYRVASVTSPSFFGATPAYQEVRLL